MQTISSYSKYSPGFSAPAVRKAPAPSRRSLRLAGGAVSAPFRNRPRHKRKFRVAFVLLLMLVAFTFGALVNAYAGDTEASEAKKALQANAVRTVDVTQGDTLWSIASEYKRDSQDVRDYVLQLKQANKLKSSMLREGQVLILP